MQLRSTPRAPRTISLRKQIGVGGKYLQFFHLPLDADAVQRFRAVSQLAEASLGGSQPVAEGRAEAVGVLDAPQLLLQLLDGVLRRRRTQRVREYRATVELSRKTTTKKLCKYVKSVEKY